MLPSAMVRVVGNRALISGHGPQALNSSLAPPFGRVGAEVGPARAREVARRVFGTVNAAPGFTE